LALKELFSGYGGQAFPLPKIAGEYKGKKLAVCGDAACVWTDLELLGCRNDTNRGSVASLEFDFLTINKLVEVFPGKIEHCYSNEAMLLRKFIAARRSEYTREFGEPKHSHSCTEGAAHRWPWGGHGTSALGAVLVGLGLGYEKIVLCGVPLDDGPHNGEPYWRKCRFQASEAASSKNAPWKPEMHWQRAIDSAFEGRVKSMSGRTKFWLGRP